MSELSRNGSGYYDVVPYKAIKNVLKTQGGKTMKDYQAGDIVEIDVKNGTKEVVLLQVFEKYAVTMELRDSEPDENAYQLRNGAMMWTDTGKFGYVYPDKVASFTRSMTQQELDDLKEAVSISLGLRCETDECDSEPTYTAEPEKTECDIAQIMQDAENAFAEDVEKILKKAGIGNENVVLEENIYEIREELKEKLIKAETERDVYKDLYTKLLRQIRS